MGRVDSTRGCGKSFGRAHALWLIATLATAGCYRSSSFKPDEIARWNLDGASHSVDIVTRAGERLHIAHYDSLVIQEAASRDRARWWEREHEYDSPVLARLTRSELEVQDAKRHALFLSPHVERITFYEYAPKRTAIVLGVSAVAAGIVAFVLSTNAQTQSPGGDVDTRPLPYLIAAGGAILTFGASMAIAFPLTSGLAEESPAATARASIARRADP